MKKNLLILALYISQSYSQTMPVKPQKIIVNEKGNLQNLAIKERELALKDSSINKFDINGSKHGLWKEYKEAFEFEGYYNHGVRDGMWTTYFSDGLVQSIENYFDGKLNGAYLQMKQGALFKIQAHYKNDLLDGIYREFNSTRIEKEINYKNGKLNGSKKLYYMNGKLIEEGNFADNLRNGITKWYNEDGKLSLEYNYVKGLLEGIQKSYYKDGKLNTETIYKNNLMEGTYTEYFEDGKAIKTTGTYSNDMKDGIWKEYDNAGKELKIERYKNNVLIK